MTFFDYIFIFDLNDIAKYLGFNLHVGYWVGLLNHGKPYYIRTDVELMWLAKVLDDKVVDKCKKLRLFGV